MNPRNKILILLVFLYILLAVYVGSGILKQVKEPKQAWGFESTCLTVVLDRVYDEHYRFRFIGDNCYLRIIEEAP